MGYLEWHAMEIARRWHQAPGWFFERPEPEQEQLWGWYLLFLSGEPYDEKQQTRGKHARERKIL